MPELASIPYVYSSWRDRDGTLWIGTASGLVRLSRGRVDRATSGPLAEAKVTALYRDREDNLWVGTSNRGLLMLSTPKFVALALPHAAPAGPATSVYAARDGALWVGGSGTLSRIHGDEVRVYRGADGPCFEAVRTIAQDHLGRLLVGGYGQPPRVCRLEGDRFVALGAPDALKDSSTIWTMMEDSARRVWLGGWSLYRFADDQFSPVAGGPSGANVFVLGEDRSGTVWAGSRRGLFRIDASGIRRFAEEDGLADQHVRAFHESADGTLWFGTLHGLTRFRGGRFEALGPREGLFDQPVFSILEDGQHRLWMCTSKGVLRVDTRTRPGAGMSFVRYGVADGLPSDGCQAEGVANAARAADGRLLFVTSRGVAVLDPERLGVAPVPPVTVERMVVDEHEVDVERPSSVDSRRRAVRIDYTAPSMTAATRLRFRYRLVGFDGGWVDAGARRSAQYTNLPPGSYRFLVTVANEDGVWNERSASVTFGVLPAWHETFAFKAALALGALLLAWGIHGWRLRIVNARHRAVLDERARLARDVHDTIAQDLLAVWMRLEAIRRSASEWPAELARPLDALRTSVQAGLDEARRLLAELRSDESDAPDLVSSLAEVAHRLAEGTGTRVRIDAQRTPGSGPPSPEIARALLRIGQEAIANALRHAAASEIAVEVAIEPVLVRLRIRDDGKGFDPSAPAPESRYGLLGIRERVARLNGLVTIDSRPGAGTSLLVEIPRGEA